MPDGAQALVDKVWHLIELDRWEQAASLCQQALAEDPWDDEALRALAECRLAQDRPDEALDLARVSLQTTPDSPEMLRIAGRAALARDWPDVAAGFATQACRIAPDQWRSHTLLADALVRSPRQRKPALQAAAHAVELAPEEAGAHTFYGWIAEECGRPGWARKAYLTALRIEPDNVEAQARLAVLKSRSFSLHGSAVSHLVATGRRGATGEASDGLSTACYAALVQAVTSIVVVGVSAWLCGWFGRPVELAVWFGGLTLVAITTGWRWRGLLARDAGTALRLVMRSRPMIVTSVLALILCVAVTLLVLNDNPGAPGTGFVRAMMALLFVPLLAVAYPMTRKRIV